MRHALPSYFAQWAWHLIWCYPDLNMDTPTLEPWQRLQWDPGPTRLYSEPYSSPIPAPRVINENSAEPNFHRRIKNRRGASQRVERRDSYWAVSQAGAMAQRSEIYRFLWCRGSKAPNPTLTPVLPRTTPHTLLQGVSFSAMLHQPNQAATMPTFHVMPHHAMPWIYLPCPTNSYPAVPYHTLPAVQCHAMLIMPHVPLCMCHATPPHPIPPHRTLKRPALPSLCYTTPHQQEACHAMPCTSMQHEVPHCATPPHTSPPNSHTTHTESAGVFRVNLYAIWLL